MPTLDEINQAIALKQQGPSIADIDAAIALKQGEQPQQATQAAEPLSKWDMVKQGFGIAQDAVEGDAQYKDAGSFEDWLWTQPGFGVNAKDMKTTFAGMFGSDKDKLNSFVKNNPDINIQVDENQNPYFEDKGKKYYLDMPGLDLGDIADFVGEGSTYTAGGALTAPVKGVMKKGAAGALAQGTANVINQKLAGREDVDLGETAGAMAGGALFEGGGQLINKLRNAKAGANALTGDKKKALDFATDNNLNLGYDDLAESATMRTLGQQVDNIPVVGGGKFREAQNLQQKAIAERTTKKYLLPDSDIDDLHSVVSTGMQTHLNRSKSIAEKKYTKIYSQLDDSMGEFDVPQLKQKAQQIIEKQMGKGSGADQRIVEAMQTYMDIPPGNMSHWAEIRSDLTSMTRDMANSTSGKNTKLVGALKQVNKELNKVMDDIVTNRANPQLQQKWRDANSFYENAVKRYEKGALKQAIRNDNPETILNILMRKGGADATDSTYKANQLFNGLDKKGKAAVRHGMMERAYTESLNGGDFSPARYATMLENYSKRLGVVLSKEDNKVVDGMRAYMRVTQQAGNFGRNTPTGQQAVPLLYTGAALGGAALDAGTTGATVLGIQAFKKLTRTPRGRSFMMALSSYPEGKTPPPKLLVDIGRYLAVKPEE